MEVFLKNIDTINSQFPDQINTVFGTCYSRGNGWSLSPVKKFEGFRPLCFNDNKDDQFARHSIDRCPLSKFKNATRSSSSSFKYHTSIVVFDEAYDPLQIYQIVFYTNVEDAKIAIDSMLALYAYKHFIVDGFMFGRTNRWVDGYSKVVINKICKFLKTEVLFDGM